MPPRKRPAETVSGYVAPSPKRQHVSNNDAVSLLQNRDAELSSITAESAEKTHQEIEKAETPALKLRAFPKFLGKLDEARNNERFWQKDGTVFVVIMTGKDDDSLIDTYDVFSVHNTFDGALKAAFRAVEGSDRKDPGPPPPAGWKDDLGLYSHKGHAELARKSWESRDYRWEIVTQARNPPTVKFTFQVSFDEGWWYLLEIARRIIGH